MQRARPRPRPRVLFVCFLGRTRQEEKHSTEAQCSSLPWVGPKNIFIPLFTQNVLFLNEEFSLLFSAPS